MYRRLLNAGLGVLLVLAGIAMLVLPGPGLLTIVGGAALMLSQWPGGRRLLARIRLRMRQRYGSLRVQRIEAHIPDELCPPADTAQLREMAEDPARPAPAPPESR